jgi:archaellum component FlaC
MDTIKEAFDKVKQDIFSIKEQVSFLSSELIKIQSESIQFKQSIDFKFQELTSKINTISIPTNPTQTPTHLNPPISTPTQTPTHQHSLEALKEQLDDFSTGNSRVPTDKPTNQQTNQQTDICVAKGSPNPYVNSYSNGLDSFEKAQEILNSLDNLKKEIRLKFKRLTPQEMSVFSAIYILEEQNVEEITYKIIAQHLKLSESSIRDYITKIKLKGIPLFKKRLNNKQITLKISPDLKKIASLSTIIKLRDL